MADVEVGLGAVVGDEDLAVLERVHRARVDVEIGVELLHHDAQSARREEVAEARGREALAQGGDDTTGHEDVLGHAVLELYPRVMFTTGFSSLSHCGSRFGSSRGVHQRPMRDLEQLAGVREPLSESARPESRRAISAIALVAVELLARSMP